MGIDSLIVFVVVLIAVVYLAYFLFKKQGCGCSSESEGSACCNSGIKDDQECCGEHSGESSNGCCNGKE